MVFDRGVTVSPQSATHVADTNFNPIWMPGLVLSSPVCLSVLQDYFIPLTYRLRNHPPATVPSRISNLFEGINKFSESPYGTSPSWEQFVRESLVQAAWPVALVPPPRRALTVDSQ
ncbi:jg12719 [Pararge aegeria aegeria]|uniref:Jg12719 protein n=1 Tax=Pararge aegeria aegeria TaxID=348720 RepID=A0A8S4S0V3_9NEOP|nr:jg12719 [Pararge aegeria aegeria]